MAAILRTGFTGDPVDGIRQCLRDLPVFADELPGFEPAATPADPVTCFEGWLVAAVAAGVREPHAMTLSTIGDDGIPSARVLLLKNVDAAGWQFAVHGASPKGRELAANGVAALTFYWPDQARQVRVRGTVDPESAESSAADFLARSDGSRAPRGVLARRQGPQAHPSPVRARLRRLDEATSLALSLANKRWLPMSLKLLVRLNDCRTSPDRRAPARNRRC